MTRVVTWLLPAFLVMTGPAAAASRADAPPLRDALAALDRAITGDMAAEAIPGLQIAIVEGAAPLWSRAYGRADLAAGRPVTEATRFGIGSISKVFTALAIMRLRDAGRLDLDDPVTRHLPWFSLAGEPHPTVTIRELMLHLGGLPREPLGLSWADRVMPSRKALIRDMAEEEPALPPETAWKYSNLGYAVLGLVVEAVSGKPFAEAVRTQVLAPLGMTDTTAAPAPGPTLALGYGVRLDGRREPRAFMPMGGMTPAAGVVSTAGDLARLALWMLDDRDTPLLAAATRREMLRAQAVLPDWSGAPGLGFELRRVGGDLRIGHSGAAAGYAARLEVDPASRLGVVVLTNADDGAPTRIAEQAIALLAPAIAAATPPAPAPVADPAWTKYLGTYRFGGRDSAIGIFDGRLAWYDPAAADPARTRIFLEPAGPGRFRFTAGALVGEILSFETDPAGQVRRMSAGGTYSWKK